MEIESHPTLDAKLFVTKFPSPLGETKSSQKLIDLLSLGADVPVSADEFVKPKVRDLLRHGGYKPTGRGKPASEYLRQADEKGKLSSINLAVDACNVASLHSGLPISVVDFELINWPAKIGIAPADSEYVFNASGQTIKLDGLLCLFDSLGPCANGVKDSQRTKTSNSTKRTLSVVWGTNELEGHSDRVALWYRELLEECGTETSDLEGV